MASQLEEGIAHSKFLPLTHAMHIVNVLTRTPLLFGTIVFAIDRHVNLNSLRVYNFGISFQQRHKSSKLVGHSFIV